MLNQTTLKSFLIQSYITAAYTSHFIIGFKYKGIVYAVKADNNIIEPITIIDKDGSNPGYCLRIRLNNKKIEKYLLQNAIPYGSEDFFENEVKKSKYNRGEIFEKWVFEIYNQPWEKNHTPFYEAGDIVINGISYQIKFDRGTFITETMIKELRENQ